MDPYIGEIRLVGFTFTPVGWEPCDGRLLSIANSSTLFALIGTTYGGDGVSTFAVPDLRSRLMVGAQNGSAGSGQSAYQVGQTAGVEAVTLTTNQMPAHTHQLAGTVAAATTGTASNNPAGKLPGTSLQNLYAAPAGTSTLAAAAVTATLGAAGSSAAHSNMPPILALNYIISVEGIFPSRN